MDRIKGDDGLSSLRGGHEGMKGRRVVTTTGLSARSDDGCDKSFRLTVDFMRGRNSASTRQTLSVLSTLYRYKR